MPTAMPDRIPAGVPPTTSATPGIATTPTIRSRGSKRLRRINGSSSAMKAGATPMQLAATDAFASLIDP